jgi:nitroimidazol reductase NimA-like FMN-containing flavoprotein (pyridoxamine 5'-phosphate oxidase superfamily)
MDLQATSKAQIVGILDAHRIMTIATNRPDGWPQATIVGYVNDGPVIHALIGRTSQKYENIARDPRVSIAIGGDTSDPMAITGLSMAARARVVTDPAQIERIASLLLERYPEYHAYSSSVRSNMETIAFLRIEPEIVSVLDYSKGFGHTDLVRLAPEG